LNQLNKQIEFNPTKQEWLQAVQKVIGTNSIEKLNFDYEIDELLFLDFIKFPENNPKYSIIANAIANSKCQPINLDFDLIINTSVLSEKGLNNIYELLYALLEAMKSDAKCIKVIVTVDENFYLNIAKIRALRFLLYKIDGLEKFVIEAQTSKINKSNLDVNNNLIRLTTEITSALIGTADLVNTHNYNTNSLDETEVQYNQFITDNINRILIEESYLDKTFDSASGSYFIDYFTLKIIEKLELFATSESSVSLDFNRLAKEHKIKKQKLIYYNKKQFIGVNKYPNSQEDFSSFNVNSNLFELYEKCRLANSIKKLKIYLTPIEEIDYNEYQPLINLLLLLDFEIEKGTFLDSYEDLANVIDFNQFQIVFFLGDLQKGYFEYNVFSNSFSKDNLFSILIYNNYYESQINGNSIKLKTLMRNPKELFDAILEFMVGK